MAFEMTRNRIVTIVAAVVIIAAALFVIYDLNGKSLDLSDRETRIIVTNSMDGSTHPAYWFECTNPDADKTHQFTNEDSLTECKICHSPVTRHDVSIDKIPVNDLVMIHKMNNGEKQSIHVGDVISFVNPSTNLLTVHRVVKINCDSEGNSVSFVTKGDNATQDPYPVNIDKVQGVVVGDSQVLGAIVHFAQGSTVLLIMIIVILIVIVSVVRDIFRMRRNDRS
ncbi:MAG: hypothetical protein MJZ38_03025 [archaeon]|nr:hypothetical protein [archaeon]